MHFCAACVTIYCRNVPLFRVGVVSAVVCRSRPKERRLVQTLHRRLKKIEGYLCISGVLFDCELIECNELMQQNFGTFYCNKLLRCVLAVGIFNATRKLSVSILGSASRFRFMHVVRVNKMTCTCMHVIHIYGS